MRRGEHSERERDNESKRECMSVYARNCRKICGSGYRLSVYVIFINVHSNLRFYQRTQLKISESSCVKITFIQDEKYNM